METVLRLAGALSWFWNRRSYLIEGRLWLDRALTAMKSPVSMSIHAEALYGAATLARAQGDFASARKFVEQSIGLWQKVGSAGKPGLSLGKVLLGNLIRDEGDLTTARTLIEDCVAFFREQGEVWNLAWSLIALGLVIRDQEDFTLARSTIEESVALWRDQGDLWGLAEALHHLGLVAYRRGDYAMAYSVMEEALAIRQRLGDKQTIAYSLHNLGVFTLAQGDKERAKQFLDQDLALFREVGDKSGVVLSLQYQGLFAHLQGDDTQAQTFIEQGLTLVRETGPRWVSSNYLLWLADVSAGRDQFERATRLCSAAKANLTASASYWDAFELGYYERITAHARASLGDEAFARVQAEGQALTLEQAIVYALEKDL